MFSQGARFSRGSSLVLVSFLCGLLTSFCFVYVTLTPCWYVLYAESSISPYENCYGLWNYCSSTGLCGKWLSGSLLGPHGVQRNACRGLMIVSCLLSGVALILNCMGMECVLLMKLSRETKEKLVRKSAVTWITAGMSCFIAVTWYAIDVMQEVWTNGRASEFSNGIFTGWAASVLSFSSAFLLFCGARFSKIGRQQFGGGGIESILKMHSKELNRNDQNSSGYVPNANYTSRNLHSSKYTETQATYM